MHVVQIGNNNLEIVCACVDRGRGHCGVAGMPAEKAQAMVGGAY